MSPEQNRQSASNKKLKGALLARSVASPLVLYPSVTAGLGALACGLFGFNLILGSLLIGGATLAAGGFLAEFGVRRESNLKQIILDATKEMEEKRAQIVADLNIEIDEQTLPRARAQLTDFKNKFATFVDVLDDRFNPGELTFIRYMSVAEQVYLSGLDNLRNAVISSKAIRSSDPDSLRDRLTKLGTSPNDEIERAALRERIKNYEDTAKKCSDLIVFNERALATLDSVTQKIARTQIAKGMADSDTESAVEELARMGTMLARYIS